MKLIHFQKKKFYKVIFRKKSITLKLLNLGWCAQPACVSYKMGPSESHVGDASQRGGHTHQQVTPVWYENQLQSADCRLRGLGIYS